MSVSFVVSIATVHLRDDDVHLTHGSVSSRKIWKSCGFPFCFCSINGSFFASNSGSLWLLLIFTILAHSSFPSNVAENRLEGCVFFVNSISFFFSFPSVQCLFAVWWRLNIQNSFQIQICYKIGIIIAGDRNVLKVSNYYLSRLLLKSRLLIWT